MDDHIDLVRSSLRKDLDSVSMIPTGVAVQLACQDAPHLAYALYVEAVYVWLFNGRDFAQIQEYLTSRMQLPDAMADRMIFTAVHVRDLLANSQGNAQKAIAALMQERGADRGVIEQVVETAIRVSAEFKVGWNRKFEMAYIHIHNEQVAKNRRRAMGCLVVLVGAIALVVWLLIRLFR